MPPKQTTHDLLLKIVSKVNSIDRKTDELLEFKTNTEHALQKIDHELVSFKSFQKSTEDALYDLKTFQKSTKETLQKINNELVSFKTFQKSTEDVLQNINNELAGFKTFQKSTTLTMKNVNDFIKRDADIIESELQQASYKHIKEIFQGYMVENYGTQLKSISNPTKPGEKLTEFDTLYLLTSMDKRLSVKNIFIIVESKRYTTNEKIDEKIEQKRVLVESIRLAKSPEFETLSSKFKNTANLHKFSKIDDVYLYIGGPCWEEGALEKIKKEKKKDPFIGYVQSVNTKYDFLDRFSYLHNGGSKKNCSKTYI